MADLKARLCLSKEPCESREADKYGSHCGLSLDIKCQYQGAMKYIFDTKEEALNFVVKEAQQ